MVNLREFLRFLWQALRWRLVAAVTLATLLSLTEGVSLALIFPVVALLGGGTGLTPGPRTAWLLHGLAASGLPRSAWLGALLVILLGAVAVLNFFNSSLNVLTLGILLRVREEISARLYRAALDADWSFLSARRSSDLSNLLTAEVDRVGTLAGAVVAIFSNGLMAVLMLGLTFFVSPALTLLVLACFAALIPWQRRVGRTIYGKGGNISRLTQELAESTVERLQHMKTIKAYGAQGPEEAIFRGRYGSVTAEILDAEWKGTSAARWFQTISIAVLGGVILLGLGPMKLSAGAMLVFLFAFLRASPRLNMLQIKLNGMLTDLPSFGRIRGFLEECAQHPDVESGAVDAPELRRELRLHGVTFAYAPDGAKVLDRVSLTLPAGQITAITGPSGAGKSTLADLALGLLVPQAGTVLVDGTALGLGNARAWRRRVGYVSQDTLLFHESIRKNLLWALPGATEGELAEAIDAAQAQFCWTLPHGLDTLAGDRGALLSHGQRQRIALARALLRKPTLLILDEATNSLDLENEASILRTVQQFGADVTTLLISHRPSALEVADKLYVLEDGRLRLFAEKQIGGSE